MHCLGVKNAVGPVLMDEGGLLAYRREFFGAYGDDAAQSAPLDLARQLVLGAVDYARALGFQPHEDYADTAEHLGGALVRCEIEFGREGKPLYVEGPYDDADAIMRTLDESVGPDGYHFVRAAPWSLGSFQS